MNITWEVSKHGSKLRLVVEAQMDEDMGAALARLERA